MVIYLVALGCLVVAVTGLLLWRERHIRVLNREIEEAGTALNTMQTQLAHATSRLSVHANRHPVTKLLVRQVVVERFHLLLTQARRYGTPFGIVIVGLSDFNSVSERIGKAAADEVLAGLAKRLLAETRAADTVGFMREHDFAVLMPQQTAAGLAAVVAKLRGSLGMPVAISGTDRAISPAIHFGVALYPDAGEDWHSVLRAADNSLLLDRTSSARKWREWEAPPPHLKEPLETLGLTWPVSMALLKGRYRNLAKQDHPDSNGGSREAEERIKVINTAYTAIRLVLEANSEFETAT